MMYLVKTEVRGGMVDELASKIVNQEIPSVYGNICYVTKDGRIGYNLIECRDESEARKAFGPYSQHVDILEVVPVESIGQFLERWKAEHGMTGQRKAA